MADQQDLARELLTRAQDDERAAQALLPAGDVSDTIVGFHAQQAVEKASRPSSHPLAPSFRSPITWVC